MIWPWLIIFIPKKYLEITIIIFISIGIVSHLILRALMPGINLVHILTPTCFDAFGMGALLAYYINYKPERLKIFTKRLAIVTLAAFLLLCFTIITRKFILPTRTLISVCALCSIVYVMKERKNLLFTYIFNNRLLIFIGKISYGVYIYHLFIPWIWRGVLKNTNIHFFVPARIVQQVILAEQFILLIGLSWISWKVFEHPINELKRYFSYDRMNKIKNAYVQPGLKA